MIKNYLKIAWRNLYKRKGFAAINIAGLALGFGCCILIFLYVSHHLEFDDFHQNSDRIYRIVTEEHRDDIDYEASVPPGFAYAFKTEYDYAEQVAKIVTWDQTLIALDQNSKLKEDIVFVQDEFFNIFNIPLINDQHISLTEPNTAFITEGTAKKLFGDESPIGKSFQLEGKEYVTIIGVLKDLPTTSLIQSEIFISFHTLTSYDGFLTNDEEWRGINSSLQCFALLHPNQNLDQIEEEISGFVQKYRPQSKNVHHYKLQPLADIHFNHLYRGGINAKALWIFALIGFFLILIASINFINISTAQSVKRSKEVGVRKVLGSMRSYLFWQFMIETFIITLLALVTGIVLSIIVLPYFNDAFNMDLLISGLWDYTFIGFIVLLLIGISFLAGIYPGMLISRIAPVLALKGKLNERDAGGLLTRKVLVTAQFAISMVLIIGTLVINKQISYAIKSDLGFNKEGIVRVGIPQTLSPKKVESLRDRIAKITGVEKITACYATPAAPENMWGTSLRYNNNPEDEEFQVQTKMGDENYLNTFDLKLIAGRNFYIKDSVDEFVVNEMFVKKVGAQSPGELLGKPISIAGGMLAGKIVGVIEDFHDQDFHNNINAIYIAPDATNYREFSIGINLDNTHGIITDIEEEWSEAYPNYIFEYDFLDERIAEMYSSEQEFLSLTKIFSGLAIFIGCLGIYGMILFFVVQKTKEIGIRKVLGGNVPHILLIVSKDFIRLVAIAGVIASPIAWYFMNGWLQNFTFQTEISWWIFPSAIGIVLCITLLTICYQAIKAATANPVKSLRTE